MNKHVVILLAEVFVEPSLGNPSKVTVKSIIKLNGWEPTPVMRAKEVCSHALEPLIKPVLLLCFREVPQRVQLWHHTEVLNLPLVQRVL